MDKLLTEQQLAEALGLKRRTIKTLRKNKVIPWIELGEKTFRYRRASVETALERLEKKAKR